MEKIAIIGSGSWGTALASVLADNEHAVSMWTRDKEVAEEIKHRQTNNMYLPNVTLSDRITCSTSLKDVVQGASVVLFAVPSQAMRSIGKKTAPYIASHAFVIHVSKGLEIGTSKRLSEVLREVLPSQLKSRIAVLSGPSHAEEVVLKKPTVITVSIKNKTIAKQIQRMFSNEYFRVYSNEDMIGVELGGSLKNIMAIGAGISDGLGLGDNAKAALLTRGLTETARFGVAFGAEPSTFYGTAGMGDLIVTGTSKHSRNWKTGNLLAKGKDLDTILEELGMVAEGVNATKAVYHIAKDRKIDMPIVCEIYHVLFHKKSPQEAVQDLMKRDFKQEDRFR